MNGGYTHSRSSYALQNFAASAKNGKGKKRKRDQNDDDSEPDSEAEQDEEGSTTGNQAVLDAMMGKTTAKDGTQYRFVSANRS